MESDKQLNCLKKGRQTKEASLLAILAKSTRKGFVNKSSGNGIAFLSKKFPVRLAWSFFFFFKERAMAIALIPPTWDTIPFLLRFLT